MRGTSPVIYHDSRNKIPSTTSLTGMSGRRNDVGGELCVMLEQNRCAESGYIFTRVCGIRPASKYGQ